MATALLAGTAPASAATDNTTETDAQAATPQGPLRLNTAASRRTGASVDEADQDPQSTDPQATPETRTRNSLPFGSSRKPVLSEFEAYVSELAGIPVQRLGHDLMLPTRNASAAVEANRQVPPDYVVGLGDEIQLTLWGSVDADLRLTVDRAGRIVIPRVGPVVVAGVKQADLNDLLTRRVGQVFRNFQLSATLGRLRSIRYYVTGFVARPGAYSVSSLATVMTGLVQAGGPSAAGSFRSIELRRGGKVVGHFDLYDLLVRGDKQGDLPLQADDVLHVGPIGPQVGVLGSVNKPAVVELKGRETVADALAAVGGLTAVADASRLALERLSDRNDRRVVQLALPGDAAQKLVNGDVLRAFSGVSAVLPQDKQYKRVRVEGEVARPGDYVLPPASTLQDAVQAAGGFTSKAYVFGTDFSRESVRKAQEENYDRALRDMEIEFTRSTSTQRAANADEAAAQAQRAAGNARLIDRLRATRPTGRIVLQLDQGARDLPALPVEENDRLYVPARPNTVGVFGSVFNGGSYLLRDGSSVDDILKLAGGPTRGADTGSTFVIRANGTVISARQASSGWLSMGSTMAALPALPGDTVFVPEEMNKTTFIQEAKDWTQILYQFGLGAAALKTIKN
ncbi:MAG: SLBB domain-containing protein [Roseateles sp.]|uniref:SLBB domain-containing protein n=1 Tax=Roseateles sp. TaxID=1971397 RepID=UPI0039E80342